MKTLISKAKSSFDSICAVAHTKCSLNGNATLLILGTVLLAGGLADVSLAQNRDIELDFNDGSERIADAAEALLRLIEGSLGALIMVVAGIAAIVAAAMGAYRAAVGMLVVAIGAFILRSLVSLFFGSDFTGLVDPE